MRSLIPIRSSAILLLFLPLVVVAQIPSPKHEFRGAWIATVTNIDWPTSNGLSSAAQQAQLTTLLDNLKTAGFNAVIFQVRTECDAFYNSSYEPWSYWLTAAQGAPPSPYYDPLQFAVQESHKRGMEIHAWFNPYRAVRPSAYTRAPNHISNTHPDWLLNFPLVSIKILDPGLPQVRDYVAMIVSDIVRRYDIDGIHADDYFYPYPDGAFSGISTEDTATYTMYKGGDSDIGHWRRENVNKLIKQIHDSVQAIKPWVKFGMSPFGIWQPGNPPGISGMNAFTTIYCDALSWLRQQSIDYLAPQLYWPFGGGQDYGRLQPWWADSTNNYGRHVYTGNATYRIGTSFGPASELANQINLNRSNPKVQGSIQFSAKWIPANVGGWTDMLKSSVFVHPSIIPPMSWKPSLTAPNAPTNLQFAQVPNSNLYSLNWTAPGPSADGDTAARYLIYRFAGTQVGDTGNSRSIIALEGATTTIPTGRIDSLGVQQYTFSVSAVDHYNHEGPLASISSIPTALVTIPELAYPFNLEQNYPRTGRIQWKRIVSASEYVLQVDTTPNFAPIATFLTTSLDDTSLSVPNLKAQSTYYWRVAAGGQANTSNYTSAWSFRTGWPLPPTPLSPLNAAGISLTPTFTWSQSGGASYELKVVDYTTRLVVVDTTVSDTTCTITRVLDRLRTHTWNVLASNAYGSSDWSAESRFRTTDATLVEASGTVPTTYELRQNYPNPYNPATSIEFAVPQTGMVRLKVYDLLGREVASLVDRELVPGNYAVRFQADYLPSGTYFYLLTSGSTRIGKKMILIK